MPLQHYSTVVVAFCFIITFPWKRPQTESVVVEHVVSQSVMGCESADDGKYCLTC